MADNDLMMQLIKDINELRAEIKRLSVNQPIYDVANENTPAQLTTNQNNYDIGNYDILRMSSSVAVSITGFTGGVKGRLLRIFNVGSYAITLVYQSASSSAANRFRFANGTSAIIVPDSNVTLYYDSTLQRWVAGDRITSGTVWLTVA